MNRLWCLAVSLAALVCASPAQAQDYPSKPIRVIASSAAGGISDIFMRTVGEELNRRWGQAIVIENRSGGGMNIGGRACAEAALPIADNVRDSALRLQASLRRRGYDSVDPDIRFDVRVKRPDGGVTGEVTVTRMIWYPWAVEGLTFWRRCAEKSGYPPEIHRALDRSLGHLLGDVGPEMLRDVTRMQRQLFVGAETYYGLGKAP